MALLGQTYTTDTMPEPDNGFSQIPPGTYQATIHSAELKDTKARTGQYIKLRFDIVGPTHQGRVVWSNLNIRNASPQAEEIGLKQFNQLLRAIGLKSCNDTDLLHGGNCIIKVGIESNDQYGDQNTIKAYEALSGSPSPAQNKAPAPAQKSSSAPWMK